MNMQQTAADTVAERMPALSALWHAKRLYCVAEVAILAAASVPTVHRWLRSGRLASVAPGRVALADLDAFLRAERAERVVKVKS